MARTNKYSSINFNDVFDQKTTPKSSTTTNHPIKPSNPNKSYLSTSRSHGGMLVLTRPSPKPQPPPQSPQPQPPPQQPTISDQFRSEPDPISLRPLGRTGTGPALTSSVPISDKEVVVVSPKTDRFVPPHLRPGFVGREERLGPELGFRPREQQGRPRSGGYERIRRGGESALVDMSRPGSSEARPSSSG